MPVLPIIARTYATTVEKDVGIFIKFLDEFNEDSKRFPSSQDCGIKYYGCFDPYWGRINNLESPRKMYFAFPGLPLTFYKVVEDFNNKFKNIKIIVIYSREFNFYHTNRDFYLSLEHYITPIENKPNSTSIPIAIPIFTIEFNPDYTKESTYFYTYLLHHFLRLLSYSERFIRIDFNAVLNETKHPVYEVLNVNNKHKGGRSLSDRYISRKNFLLLDNIEIANKASRFLEILYKRSILVKQTKILKVLALSESPENDVIIGNNEESFKEGDLIIWGRPYYISREEVRIRSLCRVEKIISEKIQFLGKFNSGDMGSFCEKIKIRLLIDEKEPGVFRPNDSGPIIVYLAKTQFRKATEEDLKEFNYSNLVEI